MNKENLSLLCDFYEFTMANALFTKGLGEKTVCFEVFFRRIPDNGGFAVFAGLSDISQFIRNLHFTNDDIAFLRSSGLFNEDFLSFLACFRFTGDVWAVREGTPVFPNEPLLLVKGKLQEVLLLETFILQTINHRSLIATKAARITLAAKGRTVIEMGARRAHGIDAAIKGCAAAYIGGVSGTTNTLAGKKYSIPVFGSMSHAWVQIFENEKTAFGTFCKVYPKKPTLLVDTFDTLKSGIISARDIFKALQIKEPSIRIDSGDLVFLSKKARKFLDNAGLNNCKIVISNALDEYKINDFLNHGGKADVFGVGENLITAKSDPVFGAVYKLTAVEDEKGEFLPKIKFSENKEKITIPHFKSLYRYYSKKTALALADEMTVFDETRTDASFNELLDFQDKSEKIIVSDYSVKNLSEPIFKNGKCVYISPSLDEIRSFCKKEISRLPDEIKDINNPKKYKLAISEKLYKIKENAEDIF